MKEGGEGGGDDGAGGGDGGGAKGQSGEVNVEIFAIYGEISLTSSLDLKR